jgi:hypothetical protein
MRTTQYRHKNTHVLYNQTVFSSFPEDLFSRHEPSAVSLPAATDSQGRGTVACLADLSKTPTSLAG